MNDLELPPLPLSALFAFCALGLTPYVYKYQDGVWYVRANGAEWRVFDHIFDDSLEVAELPM